MPTSEKQKRAARAEYGRRKSGEKPQNFQGMSTPKLKEWSTSAVHKKKKK